MYLCQPYDFWEERLKFWQRELYYARWHPYMTTRTVDYCLKQIAVMRSAMEKCYS